MAFGVSRKPVEYILENDRGRDRKFQTVFHIVPRRPRDDAGSLRRYSAAMIERRGQRRVDPDRWSAADKEELYEFCKKIENFFFSEDFLADHPEMAARCKEATDDEGNTYRAVPILSGVSDIGFVYDNLSSDHFNELVEVSKSLERLSEGEKKDLRSPVTSDISEQPSLPKKNDISTVRTASSRV